MNELNISLIVPVYNAEQYLPKCLDSLVNQSYKDIEILCINDGSSDNSLSILKEYAQKGRALSEQFLGIPAQEL